jgi:Zn-dependent protease
MSSSDLIPGLIQYLCFLPVLTFHEFAHAWMAWKCGDDTARLQGRVTLNPLAHMEVIGTVVLPLMAIMLSASGSPLAGFIIGWGKPVPVNIYNLKNRRRDDTLIALAGPAMNVLIALVFIALARVGIMGDSELAVKTCFMLASISLFLGFFNMLPIPPLDGSHLMKNMIGMSDETYMRFSQFGFIILIVAIQMDFVQNLLYWVVHSTLVQMMLAVGIKF